MNNRIQVKVDALLTWREKLTMDPNWSVANSAFLDGIDHAFSYPSLLHPVCLTLPQEEEIIKELDKLLADLATCFPDLA